MKIKLNTFFTTATFGYKKERNRLRKSFTSQNDALLEELNYLQNTQPPQKKITII